MIERANRRIDTLSNRIDGVVAGQTPPDPDNVRIGSGKHYSLAVMFLDITGFTEWPSSNSADQKRVLYVMDIFMAEMLNVIKDHGGIFEKNTGDGLMAYFGADNSPRDATVRVFTSLPAGWSLHTTRLASTGYEYVVSRLPYGAWALTHRLVGWPVA